MPFSCLLLCFVVFSSIHSIIHWFIVSGLQYFTHLLYFDLLFFTLPCCIFNVYLISCHFISYKFILSFGPLCLIKHLAGSNRSCKKMRLALLPLLANKVPAWHRIQVNFKEHLWSVATKKQVCSVLWITVNPSSFTILLCLMDGAWIFTGVVLPDASCSTTEPTIANHRQLRTTGLKDDLLRPPLQAKAASLVEMPHFEVNTRHGATTWLHPMIMKGK